MKYYKWKIKNDNEKLEAIVKSIEVAIFLVLTVYLLLSYFKLQNYILIGIIGTILLSIVGYFIIIRLNKRYEEKCQEIKDLGKKTTGKIIDIKHKYRDSDDSFYSIFSVTIEYIDPYTEEKRQFKTPYTTAYSYLNEDNECELYIYNNKIYVEKTDDVENDYDIEETTKSNGKKITATITKMTIRTTEKFITIKYTDPESNEEKTHQHRVYFNPKRLESNKCTLYKDNCNYFIDDFVLGDEVEYKTNKDIEIKDYVFQTPEEKKRDRKILFIGIILLVIFILIVLILSLIRAYNY